VRDKVSQIQGRFPRDTQPPRVNKQDPDQYPILTLAIFGDREPKELTEIVDKKLKQPLETISGVGGIQFNGDRRRQIQLLLDADRLTAYGLTAEGVRNSIERQNIEIPGGNFVAGPSEIALRTMGRLTNLGDFKKIILSQQNGSVTTFGDIGRVTDSVQEIRQVARVDGKPSISLEIRKQSGSNTVAVVDAVMARLNAIKPSLPSDIQIATHSASPDPGKLTRVAGRVFVPAQHPQHGDCGDRHPGLADCHVHRDENLQLHAEQHDFARAVVGDRYRHRRRDRRAREHLQVRRGKGRIAARSRR
ncbi:MAG: hypothetical protein DMG13_20320, partial [Acidobacteria bacterium]